MIDTRNSSLERPERGTSRRRAGRIAGAVAVLGLAVTSFTGSAGAASSTETFRFVLTGDPAAMTPGRVVATGQVNAAGTVQAIAHQENADGTSTDTEILALPSGTINFNDTTTSESFDLNPVSCVASVRTGGRYVIQGGTGTYATAVGRGTFTGHGVIVFRRSGTGCSQEVTAAVFVFTAHGSFAL
ncbi:MAG: hypothetical protein M3256_26760 [Actinomycetota bacterium]|nr:hypothetical protein [Actinomycetota bacterium]